MARSNRIPITTVFGPPIDVEKIEASTEKDIVELRTKYIHALDKLYTDHRDKHETTPNQNGLHVLH
jgi:hypothetical protein